MRDAEDELDPPFEIIEPAEWRGPVVFNSPHANHFDMTSRASALLVVPT